MAYISTIGIGPPPLTAAVSRVSCPRVVSRVLLSCLSPMSRISHPDYDRAGVFLYFVPEINWHYKVRVMKYGKSMIHELFFSMNPNQNSASERSCDLASRNFPRKQNSNFGSWQKVVSFKLIFSAVFVSLPPHIS